jgi:hypothetical protein
LLQNFAPVFNALPQLLQNGISLAFFETTYPETLHNYFPGIQHSNLIYVTKQSIVTTTHKNDNNTG